MCRGSRWIWGPGRVETLSPISSSPLFGIRQGGSRHALQYQGVSISPTQPFLCLEHLRLLESNGMSLVIANS